MLSPQKPEAPPILTTLLVFRDLLIDAISLRDVYKNPAYRLGSRIACANSLLCPTDFVLATQRKTHVRRSGSIVWLHVSFPRVYAFAASRG